MNPKVSVSKEKRKYNHEWYLKNRDRMIARTKQWVKDNPERAKINFKRRSHKYYQSPKGIYRVLIMNSKRKGKTSGLTQDEFINWYQHQEKVCHYCGKPQDSKRLEIDRKDSSIGYFLTNIVLACKDCNQVKSNILSHEEMLIVGVTVMKARWQL